MQGKKVILKVIHCIAMCPYAASCVVILLCLYARLIELLCQGTSTVFHWNIDFHCFIALSI